MSQEERSTVVSILVNVLVDAFIILKLYGLWQAGAFEGPDGLQVWARAVLWSVPLAIGGSIVLSILASILHSILTGEKHPQSVSDERDHRYQLRGMATTMIMACFGALGGVIALAFGHSAIFGLTVIWFSMSAGVLAGDVTKILSYRVWG